LCFLALDAIERIKQAGLEGAEHDITITLSHAGIVRAVLAAAGLDAEEQSAAYDRLLDGDLMVVDEVEARLPELNAPLRMLFEVEGQGSAYLTNIREPLAAAIPGIAAALDELAFVVAALELRGVTPLIRSVLARRFEYYSGVILRVEAGGRRIIAGGRYDELVGLVGGRRVPASGFALYLTPLLELLAPARRIPPVRVVVTPATDDAGDLAATYAAAERLRSSGLFVESVEGMHSTPTHRVSCAASAGYTLTSPEGSVHHPSIDDVARALEPSH
jgi:ATP phosphoribosyltransferase regulatory subunit HisZ